MSTAGRAGPVAALVILAGCTNIERGAGFEELKEDVARRTGTRVHWNNGSVADAEVAAAVESLLGRELSADDAVQISLLNNRDLQSVYEELNLAQADLVQAGLLSNPIFSGNVRFDTDGGGTGVGLSVAQNFLSLLAIPMRRARAEAEFEAAKIRVTGAVLDAAYGVRTAFHDYQAAEQLRELLASVVEATGASYELAQRIRAAGNSRALDAANERIIHEEARADLAAAEGDVIRTRERLNAFMGLWGARTQWRAATRLPALPGSDPNPEGLERRAIEASLDLALLRREAEIGARAAGIARPFGWLGDAEVGATAEREVEGGWSVGPSLSVPIPILDQGQARIAGAEARFRQSREQYFARAVEIRARVRAAYSAAVVALDRARHYEKIILPLRQTILDETFLQYNAMQVPAKDLLQAKRDQIEAGAAYVGALRAYWRAAATLDQVLTGRMTPFEQTSIAIEPVSLTPDGDLP